MIKEGIHINGIYKHYKGSYYKIESIAYHHQDGKPIVVYSRCNPHGIYLSIRESDGTTVRVHQPFYRDLVEFNQEITVYKGETFQSKLVSIFGIGDKVKRFTFYKNANI